LEQVLADLMPFLSLKQQCQSIEGKYIAIYFYYSALKLIIISPIAEDLVALISFDVTAI